MPLEGRFWGQVFGTDDNAGIINILGKQIKVSYVIYAVMFLKT